MRTLLSWSMAATAVSLGALSPAPAVADQLVLDRAIRAGGLWCLPSAGDPLRFRYLPETARLARGDDDRPLFSIIYYSEPQSAAGSAVAVRESAGGALLTMMVEYSTPRASIARAERSLRDLIDTDAVLEGPVVFDRGTYALVSSIGTEATVAFASGEAPVLEGGQVALSLQFDARAARKLAAALTASTPDLSVVFDMTYAGVRSSYDADIHVDWDKASESLDAGAALGVSVYGVSVGGEIEKAVTEMMNSGAITVDVTGEDASMDAIVTHVQEMATKLFFTPFEDPDAAEDFADPSSIGDVGQASAGANRYFSINATVKYKRKRLATAGTSTFSLRKREGALRRWSIVFNGGEVAADLRDDPLHVRTVDLTDSALSERTLEVQLDVGFRRVFEEFADLATVELRKRHAGDRETFRQATFTAQAAAAGQSFAVTYPRFEGDAWNEWLAYESRTVWELKDGATYQTAWRRGRSPQIVVSAPVQSATIHPLGDVPSLATRGVRAVIIEVSYPFLGGDRTEIKTVVTSAGGIDPFEVLVPREVVDFSYRVTHVYPDRRETFRSSDRGGFVVIDPE